MVPVVMMTHDAREKNMRLALDEIDRLDAVKKKPWPSGLSDRMYSGIIERFRRQLPVSKRYSGSQPQRRKYPFNTLGLSKPDFR